jgi:uncharacterized membrane protein YgdD (TMEM256/DUF423 family)
MRSSTWIAIGAASGFLSVALGAFGAHGLAKILDEHSLSVFRTGAQYQMYHALGLILWGLWLAQKGTSHSFVGWAFLAGTFLFCGSLYALALTQTKWLGAVAPLGGLSFMAGWVGFCLAALKSQSTGL